VRKVKVGFVRWTKGPSNFGTLDLSAHHLAHQLRLALHKARMVVGTLVLGMVSKARERVEVQLTLEGRIFGLTKESGHDGLGKLLDLVHFEGSSVGKP